MTSLIADALCLCSQPSTFCCLWSKNRILHQRQKIHARSELMPTFSSGQSSASAMISMFQHCVSWDSPPFLWHFTLLHQLLLLEDYWRCAGAAVVIFVSIKIWIIDLLSLINNYLFNAVIISLIYLMLITICCCDVCIFHSICACS